MSAREAIFGKLRAASVADAPALPDVAAWYAAQRRTENTAQRTARLRAALEAARTEVHVVSHSNWTAKLLQLCSEKQLHSLLVGNNTPHGAAMQSCAPHSLQVLRYEQPIAKWQGLLFDRVDASLTLAKSAIAETGSLILWPTPAEPRLMSLVPSVHFVLLDEAAIHADFHAAMTAEGWANGMPTNALLISGPSKTADIQQTLAYGAHGPKELVLLLLQAEGESEGKQEGGVA
jgi:L-lactate dehydrogenase complex protein LldG